MTAFQCGRPAFCGTITAQAADDRGEESCMLDLQKLRMFVAAAHTRNFTRAAAQLDLTQPTVSQQIQTLERELGAPLFERLGRGIELTAAGHALLEHAEQMLALERIAEHAVRTAAGLH